MNPIFMYHLCVKYLIYRYIILHFVPKEKKALNNHTGVIAILNFKNNKVDMISASVMEKKTAKILTMDKKWAKRKSWIDRVDNSSAKINRL